MCVCLEGARAYLLVEREREEGRERREVVCAFSKTLARPIQPTDGRTNNIITEVEEEVAIELERVIAYSLCVCVCVCVCV